jgi:hypothetical protein
MNEVIAAGIIFITAAGAAVAIATQAFRRPTSIGKMPTGTQLVQPTKIEEASVNQPVPNVKTEVTSKDGLSNEEFKTLFLNADTSIEDIADACGYKSNSSVYRRAKRLGLAVDARKK